LAERPKRKKPHRKPPQRSRPDQPAPRKVPGAVSVRRTADGNAWELVHPRCAVERREDIEEVESMIALGEAEIAVEELRWLLGGCHEFIDGHYLLGEMALAEGDLNLARGHFGYAYQLGLAALRRAGMPAPLPYDLAPNRQFFESGKGLVHCLVQLGKPELAREVVDALLGCDPCDPLGLRGMLNQLPIVDP
jgi:hypothetical protein